MYLIHFKYYKFEIGIKHEHEPYATKYVTNCVQHLNNIFVFIFLFLVLALKYKFKNQ